MYHDAELVQKKRWLLNAAATRVIKMLLDRVQGHRWQDGGRSPRCGLRTLCSDAGAGVQSHGGHRGVVFGLFVLWRRCRCTEVTDDSTEIIAARSSDCLSAGASVWNCEAAVSSCGADPAPSRSTRAVRQSWSCCGHHPTHRLSSETCTGINCSTDVHASLMELRHRHQGGAHGGRAPAKIVRAPAKITGLIMFHMGCQIKI